MIVNSPTYDNKGQPDSTTAKSSKLTALEGQMRDDDTHLPGRGGDVNIINRVYVGSILFLFTHSSYIYRYKCFISIKYLNFSSKCSLHMT